MEKTIDIDMVKEAKKIIVKVYPKRIREFRVRLWIAMKLVKLATRIANFTYRENNELKLFNVKKGYNPPPSDIRPTVIKVTPLPEKSKTSLEKEVSQFLRSIRGRRIIQQIVK